MMSSIKRVNQKATTKDPLSAGLISLGAYIPAKPVPENKRIALSRFLTEQTKLHPSYVNSITGHGCLPGTIESNHDGWEKQPWFEKWLENIPEKFKADPFQGTKERRRVPYDPISLKQSSHPHPMLPSDAETLAGAMALFNAQINPEDIDLVLVRSLISDHMGIPNAPLVQHKLGLSNASAFDINSGCASFGTLLDIATALIQAKRYKNILVVNSSLAASHTSDKTQRYGVLFGDAAIAGIVSTVSEGHGHICSASHSDGSMHDAMVFRKSKPHLQSRTDLSQDIEQWFFTYHDMAQCKKIFKYDEEMTVALVEKILTNKGMGIADVDFYLTEQPFIAKFTTWRESLNIPPHKFYHSFEKYGHCMGASVGINFVEAIEAGLIKAGDNVLMTCPGAGGTLTALLHKTTSELIENTCRLSNTTNKE